MASDSFTKLVEIFTLLRDPVRGCPWDLKQTHASLKQYLLEEAYEVLEAIDHLAEKDGPQKLLEELGDVLLQVLLHSQIAKDAGTFSIEDVITTLSEKLIKRHPHVFGTTVVRDAAEVVKNWEAIKNGEKPQQKSILTDLSRAFPALFRAHKIGEKVARVGFDWDTVAGVQDKVVEELKEFLDDLHSQPPQSAKVEEELGDLFFSMAQLARKLGFNPEEVLQKANEKFMRRFEKMEQKMGHNVENKTPAELEVAWHEVKARERRS